MKRKPLHRRQILHHNHWILVVSILFFSITSQGQDLFTVINNARLTSQQHHYLNTILDNPWTIGHQIIDVNEDALGIEFTQVKIGDQAYRFNQKSVTYRDHDDYSWAGSLIGAPGRISIVVNHDMITSIMRIDGQTFVIYPLDEGLHVLAQLKTSYFPKDCAREFREDEIHESGPDDPKNIEDPVNGKLNLDGNDSPDGFIIAADCRVRLLVAFTDDVDGAYADPHSLVQGSIDDHNQANANSEVNHRVELARSMRVNYDESSDSVELYVEHFEGTSDGNMDEIHDDRALFDADVCVLITLSGGGFCGFASGIGSEYETAFCVAAAGCAIDNHTFAHEVGHIHGCRHDPYVDPNEDPDPFAHGYVYNTNAAKWRTIMAYNDQCDCSDEAFPCPPSDQRDTPGEPVCERQQNWSTPDVTLDGVPMGTEKLHKNERLLDQEDDNTAAYEGYVINKTVYSGRTIEADEAFDIHGQETVTTVLNQPLVLNNGSRGTMRASIEITLREGFHGRSGSEFHAFLEEACDDLTLTGEDPEEEVAVRENGSPLSEEAAFVAEVKAFPNPFRDKTMIEYRFSAETQVSIRVYDVFGRLVNTLPVNETVVPNVLHQHYLDGSNLAAGTYTCIVETSEKEYSLRLVKIDQ